MATTEPVLESGSIDGNAKKGGFLKSDPCFPKFIGFLSNPTFAIDPRSLTQLYPLYIFDRTQATRLLPAGDINAAGPGLNVAVTNLLATKAMKPLVVSVRR